MHIWQGILPLVLYIWCIRGQRDSHREIRRPPAFLETPKTSWTSDYYITEGRIVLACTASGTPKPSYSWKFKGEDLVFNDPNIKQVPDVTNWNGTIVIEQANTLTEGDYQCSAKNSYGTAVSDKVDLVRAYLVPGTPTTEPVPVRGEANHPAVLVCGQPRSNPPPNFSWVLATGVVDKYPVRYHLSARVQMDDNGNLRFAYLEEADEHTGKIFKCQANNPQIDITSAVGYSALIVDADQGLTKPKVELAFKNDLNSEPMIGLLGKSLRFRCIFSGKPVPRITWEKVGGSLPPGRHDVTLYDTEMTITDLDENDDGEYKCTGVNKNNFTDTASHTFRAIIQAMPEFLSEDDQVTDRNVTIGESLEFHCRARGNPPPTLKWTIDGLDPDHIQRPRLHISEDKETLYLRDVCKVCPGLSTDLMVVQCNASNSHGYAYSQGYINVLEPTKMSVPPKDIYLENKQEQFVIFQCLAISDPSTPITYSWLYKDGHLSTKGPWQLMPDGSLNITVANDTAEILIGKYTCIADNTYTNDRASAELYPSRDEVIVAGFPWWIIVVIVCIFLFLILVIICCVCTAYWYKTKGDVYNVDEKERAHGLYPEEELFETGYHEYQRPEAPSRKPSRADSLSSTAMLCDDYASRTGTLDSRGGTLDRGYSMDSLGRFNEEGSFIGQYATGSRR
ncbi:hypothetical protein CAPTEDRAFT_221071 [Capitella teleta]|uniref:Ig-like domain-containing protein n=1 Tax=Capitella teleta TaxID=283909 RepID=R7TBR1_CAPTE|nr:hypothetical protein CAPTEDRAFT_221071 [Capitella teleta]|eukprot:ELT88536.1 hypothetical protein CAPTEDRAFT_221071 [Capitella teleta]